MKKFVGVEGIGVLVLVSAASVQCHAPSIFIAKASQPAQMQRQISQLRKPPPIVIP